MPVFQENNLDFSGRLIWETAPAFDLAGSDAYPFIIKESGRFNARPKFFSKREGADGHLLLYTQSGKGLLRYRGGEYELAPGSTALIDCNEYHEYRTFDGANGHWAFYWLHFFGDQLSLYKQLIFRGPFSVFDLGGAPLPMLENVLKALPLCDPQSMAALSDAVHGIIMLLVKAARPSQRAGKDGESAPKQKIMEALAYIKANYWHALVLEHVAGHVNLSTYYFIRAFKKYTGMTPYRFLIVERVNVAKQLLQTTDMQVYEISVMVGFRSDSHFVKTFKSIAGVTPLAYRLRLQG